MNEGSHEILPTVPLIWLICSGAEGNDDPRMKILPAGDQVMISDYILSSSLTLGTFRGNIALLGALKTWIESHKTLIECLTTLINLLDLWIERF